MPKLNRQPSVRAKSAATVKPLLPQIKADYPPGLRRQMLVHLMSKLGKRRTDAHI